MPLQQDSNEKQCCSNVVDDGQACARLTVCQAKSSSPRGAWAFLMPRRRSLFICLFLPFCFLSLFSVRMNVWCRQAALQALTVLLEAFEGEDHFQAVCEPLLATPHQHIQAAATPSVQVIHTQFGLTQRGLQSGDGCQHCRVCACCCRWLVTDRKHRGWA